MKKILTVLLALVISLSAAFVDQNRAQKLAESHYKNYAPNVALKNNSVQRIIPRKYDGEITMYTVVFNDGFVIVTAEDNLKPILGYSYETVKEIPDNGNGGTVFESWFGNYDKQIVEARKSGYSNPVAVKQWESMEAGEFTKGAKGIVVAPLIESHWNQEYPYNDQCPSLGEAEGNCQVGCVATATAQIIRYHEQDVVGYGYSSYYWTAGNETLSIDHSTQTFDYSLMPLLGYSTQAEVDELAKLCMNVGYAVSMQYDTRANGGSGAYSSDVDDALLDHFGYMTANYISHGTPTVPNPTWVSDIETSLDNGLPIVYSGSGADGGHAFNLDGYSTDNWYHFNWGWGGAYDGNYQLDNLNPSSDFTQGQAGVYDIATGWPPPWSWPSPQNFAGSIADGEDIILTWNAPVASAKVLIGYNIYRQSDLYDTVGLVTSYEDTDLASGMYSYYLKAVYEDGLSHNTPSYSITVTADDYFPVTTAFQATTMGRTSIDLEWIKPYTGTLYFGMDFETGNIALDWHHKRTVDYPATGRRVSETRDNFTQADITDGWFLCDENSFNDPQYIHDGLYSMAIGYDTPDMTWAFSPSFTIDNNDAQLRYWHWITGNAANVWLTNCYVGLYSGDFTETDPSLNWNEVAAYVDIDETTENKYDTQVVIDLSAYTGTYRIAWVYDYTNGFQMAIDDIIIGTASKSTTQVSNNISQHTVERIAMGISAKRSGNAVKNLDPVPPIPIPRKDDPIGYEIYRNNALASTINGGDILTWCDIGFADGDNEYYVKVLYPTGTSLASTRVVATIIANPAPGYLTGVLNANQSDVDLSWYAPLTLPPHWYGYIDALDETFDNVDGLTGSWSKRRTLFTATALGMTYPITVDSLSVAFYEENAGDWDNDWYTLKIYTAAFDGSDSILMAETANMTAVSDYWLTHALSSSLLMNMGWYVEIGNLGTDGTPSSLVFTHPDGTSRSTVYYGGDGTYDPDWYTIAYGGDSGDWAILCYGQGSEQTWYYNKEEVPVEKLAMSSYKKLPALSKDKEVITSIGNKSMVQYNIYRNGSLIGDTVFKIYTDVNVPGGDNSYYVTAEYCCPFGESAPSNEIYTFGLPNPYPYPPNVTTSSTDSTFSLTWETYPGLPGDMYKIYASDDPYGEFTLVDSMQNPYTYEVMKWEVPLIEARKFYYVINEKYDKKDPLKEIKH